MPMLGMQGKVVGVAFATNFTADERGTGRRIAKGGHPNLRIAGWPERGNETHLSVIRSTGWLMIRPHGNRGDRRNDHRKSYHTIQHFTPIGTKMTSQKTKSSGSFCRKPAW